MITPIAVLTAVNIYLQKEQQKKKHPQIGM